MYYIYLIVNSVNGKTYVGQRKSSKEWYEDKYMGSGKILKQAINKYGIENFEKFLIQHCYSKEETDKAERFWIAEYRRRGKAEYNIADGGTGGNLGEEVARLISEANKGNQNHKGKHHTEDAKKKMSEAAKGRQSYWRGKHLTEEAKRKSSESHKGKHWYNNGEVSVTANECPEGFVKGRICKLVDGKRVYY